MTQRVGLAMPLTVLVEAKVGKGQAIVEEIRILSLLLEVSPFQFRDLNTTFELTVYIPNATLLPRVFQ